MTPLLENCLLDTDLDCNHFSLLNVKGFFPLPSNIVTSDDPRLSDARAPLPGSVTNNSIDPNAAIDQSKLNLNGPIPSNWLGTTTGTAADGSLAEYINHKGNPGGYAELDGSGKVPSLQLPTGIGSGTVTSVGLNMPLPFTVSSSPITGSGTIGVTWQNQADQSWFGNNEGSAHTPKFYTTALPTALIPSLDASKITTGTFDPARLPVAVGIGSSHAPGAVPDPGPTGGGALATDYLARDMTYKAAPSLGATYQPTVGTPTISHSTNTSGPQIITAFVSPISGTTTNYVYFYSLTSSSTGFLEFPSSGQVSLAGGAQIWVYAAAAGFTNSAIATYTNPNP